MSTKFTIHLFFVLFFETFLISKKLILYGDAKWKTAAQVMFVMLMFVEHLCKNT